MTSTLIKMCGLSTPDAVEAAIKARADYIGLIFFDKSPRHVSFETARQLAARSAGRVSRVGVFVDADEAMVADAIAAGMLDAVQLHGKETPQRVAEIKARFGLPVWKAISVKSAADIAASAAFHGIADRLLFDAKTPDGAALPGGMGIRFDWDLMRDYKGPPGWGLSGGLSADNVGQALAATAAPLVDVSSGIESEPGVKDVDKIARFAYAVRHYDKH